jgi:hypothetical protein
MARKTQETQERRVAEKKQQDQLVKLVREVTQKQIEAMAVNEQVAPDGQVVPQEGIPQEAPQPAQDGNVQ